MQNTMTTINDQPQHLLARYADRTGGDYEMRRLSLSYTNGQPGQAFKAYTEGFEIRLVLSEYGLPSHLKPYKDNPRLPGDGYRVPTGEDSCNQPHELWSDGKWIAARQVDVDFSNLSSDYRLTASVLPPDWDEMTREDAPAKTSQAQTSPKWGTEKKAYHEGKVIEYRCMTPEGWAEWEPCRREPKWESTWQTEFRVKAEQAADAPEKLPRPEQPPQDDVQELEEQIAASTPTLRPIAEMPAEVPEGCARFYSSSDFRMLDIEREDSDTHFIDIRIPAPPDPDEELRREFGAWWESLQTKPLGKNELFIAYKAGQAKEGAR